VNYTGVATANRQIGPPHLLLTDFRSAAVRLQTARCLPIAVAVPTRRNRFVAAAAAAEGRSTNRTTNPARRTVRDTSRSRRRYRWPARQCHTRGCLEPPNRRYTTAVSARRCSRRCPRLRRRRPTVVAKATTTTTTMTKTTSRRRRKIDSNGW